MSKPDFPIPLMKAKRLAHMLDSAFRIPVIGVRIGFDSLFGLIPAIGDALMLLTSLKIISYAKQLGVPGSMRAAMYRNCGIDFALGFIPVVGDVVDLFYKANNTNVAMMEKWWIQQHQHALNSATEEALEQWESQQSE